jgi:ubiquinol-cytochrome c reductase cytochrome b subunit
MAIMSITARLERAVDRSPRARRLAESLRHQTVALHWTNAFGVAAIACLVVLIVTGVYLMFFYTPSSARTVYDGGYAPLHGVEMSRALASTLSVSLDVRGGLLVRQAHHWAALLLPAAIIGQLVVTFFTGAFRRPRRGAWVLLFLALIAALAAGWSGYALPDDMLSGTGQRIVEGIVLGIPVVGTWAAGLLFGGGVPGRIVENLFVIHLVVSAALIAIIAARVRALRVRSPQHFPGRSDAIAPLAIAARRSVRTFIAVCVILVLISATVTVSPIWLYGPSDPGNASAGSQPDWYTGFLDGALRLVPPGWEVQLFGGTLTLAVLVPLAVVGAFLAAVVAYPFLEGWVTRDAGDPRLLDRPRSVPTRTAIGVGGMTFYAVLWGAASSDVLATAFGLSLETVITAFQVLLLVGPPIAFSVTRRICLGLLRKDRDLLVHGHETGRIVRMPGGEYVEQHQPLTADERRRRADPGYAPVLLRPDARGRLTVRERVRAAGSRLLLRDRLAPVSGSIPIGAAAQGQAGSEQTRGHGRDAA